MPSPTPEEGGPTAAPSQPVQCSAAKGRRASATQHVALLLRTMTRRSDRWSQHYRRSSRTPRKGRSATVIDMPKAARSPTRKAFVRGKSSGPEYSTSAVTRVQQADGKRQCTSADSAGTRVLLGNLRSARACGCRLGVRHRARRAGPRHRHRGSQDCVLQRVRGRRSGPPGRPPSRRPFHSRQLRYRRTALFSRR